MENKHKECKKELKKIKSEIRKKEAEIKKLSALVDYDELTGLYNRSGFRRQVDRFIRQIKKERWLSMVKIKRHLDIHNVSIIFADLNDFKKINDTYGHDVGDKLIYWFGKFLKDAFRDIDIVCRWSGDEFVVAMINAEKEDGQKKIKKIQAGLKENFLKVGKDKIFASSAFGAASIFDPERKPKFLFDIHELIKEADLKMYKNKKLTKRV